MEKEPKRVKFKTWGDLREHIILATIKKGKGERNMESVGVAGDRSGMRRGKRVLKKQPFF